MKTYIVSLVLFVLTVSVYSQEISWKRTEVNEPEKVYLFHSNEVANLPTAQTLSKNLYEFEISHRFIKTVDSHKSDFGLDGPAIIRMAMSYGITNDLMVSFGRSNQEDNYDLRIKYKAFQVPSKLFPVLAALQVGGAWNTQAIDPATGKERDLMVKKNFQYYGQLIFNTMIAKKLGIGIIPSYLYNSHIYCEDTEYSFTIGGYAQYYLSAMFSFFVETNSTVTGWRQGHNPVAIGLEIETGGHFFKIFFGNSHLLNPSQYLTGADLDIYSGEWRLGFNITRLLKF